MLWVQNATLMLALRFLQAIGVCAAAVTWQAMVTDYYPAQRTNRIFATIMPLVGLSPALAPLLGSWLLVMAVVGTIMPAALNYVLVQRVGATRASVSMFLMPMIAVLFGTVFLGERLGLNALAGMALILCGSVIVNGAAAVRRSDAEPAPGGTAASAR